MRPLSLVSINVENSKHAESVGNFLKDRKADVICLQELLEAELSVYENSLHMKAHFVPLTIRPRDDNGKLEKEGIAILSKFGFKSRETNFYRGSPSDLKIWNKDTVDRLMETVHAAVAKVDIEFENRLYSIATTHFTWSPNGMPNAYQERDFEALLPILKKNPSLILTGDFNAPRGGEIFSELALQYKDNIPEHYESSIDPELHIRKGLKLMVDGLFSTPDYSISGVELISGISDHMAITANVQKMTA